MFLGPGRRRAAGGFEPFSAIGDQLEPVLGHRAFSEHHEGRSESRVPVLEGVDRVGDVIEGDVVIVLVRRECAQGL